MNADHSSMSLLGLLVNLCGRSVMTEVTGGGESEMSVVVSEESGGEPEVPPGVSWSSLEVSCGISMGGCSGEGTLGGCTEATDSS